RLRRVLPRLPRRPHPRLRRVLPRLPRRPPRLRRVLPRLPRGSGGGVNPAALVAWRWARPGPVGPWGGAPRPPGRGWAARWAAAGTHGDGRVPLAGRSPPAAQVDPAAAGRGA